MSKTLRLNVPKQVRGKKLQEEYLHAAEAIVHEQTVLRLYQEKKVSTGAAAKMLGMALADFMRYAGLRQVSVFPEYTDKELAAELRGARRVQVRSNQKKKP